MAWLWAALAIVCLGAAAFSAWATLYLLTSQDIDRVEMFGILYVLPQAGVACAILLAAALAFAIAASMSARRPKTESG